MGHLLGCYNAAVALECATKAYLMMEFQSGYDPMICCFLTQTLARHATDELHTKI